MGSSLQRPLLQGSGVWSKSWSIGRWMLFLSCFNCLLEPSVNSPLILTCYLSCLSGRLRMIVEMEVPIQKSHVTSGLFGSHSNRVVDADQYASSLNLMVAQEWKQTKGWLLQWFVSVNFQETGGIKLVVWQFLDLFFFHFADCPHKHVSFHSV